MASRTGFVANDAVAITKNDTAELSDKLVGLYVGGAGDVAVLTHGGRTLTFSAVPVGTILPIPIRRVMSTGTTATLIIGFLA